jgi:ABC-type polysaccharide/polyol phosphate transport system ATPase subunit
VSESAVVVDHVSKRFRLYRERNQSLKSALMRGRTSAYDEFWAVRDVSFEVPAGSTFGLIGRNGSGKSTLLKTLARILVPDEGSVTMRGRVASLLEVGSGFHPELSGRENVYLNGSILGMKKKEIDGKFDEIVDFSGVRAFIDQPVKNYSSGMYVRLGFSVAVHVRPDILIVDEVLAVGDAAFRTRSKRRFAQLKSDGRTIILVSHSMPQVLELCDRVGWMDEGRLRMIGEPAEVTAAYLATVEDGSAEN